MKRILAAVLLALAVAGCGAATRSNKAEQAQTDLVGFSKEQILVCMGAPMGEKTVGQTEVWTYRANEVIGGDGNGGNAISHTCTANILFQDDTVADFSFGTTVQNYAVYSVCYPLIQNCVR